MMSITTSSRLLILACSATKRAEPDDIPAIDRYNGPLWQTLRCVDPDGSKARVAFLSTRYGFRDARAPIEIYDARMTEEIAAAMKPAASLPAGRGPRRSAGSCRRVNTPACTSPLAALSAWGRNPFLDVALDGGHLCLDVVRHFVGLFREGGHVAGNARIVEINGPIGQMRHDLRVWLDTDGREAS